MPLAIVSKRSTPSHENPVSKGRFLHLAAWLAGMAIMLLPLQASGRDVSYSLMPGDTLFSLSSQYLAKGRTYRDLQRYNRIDNPRRIPAGRDILIPVEWLRLRPEAARLSAFRGDVRVAIEQRSVASQLDMSLPQRSVIETREKSFATMVLPDGSLIYMLPNSVVRITSLNTMSLTGDLVRLIDVVTGRIQTKVTPGRRGGDSFRIRTPLAVASVRGTEFRTVVDPRSGGNRIEVLKGLVAVSNADNALLSSGQGIATAHDGLGPQHALLPAPRLAYPGKVQDSDTLVFPIAPLDGAAQWHAVLAGDAGFVEQIDESISDTPQASFPSLPDSIYFVRISAISADGFEGLSRDYAFTRQRYQFDANVGIDNLNGHRVFRFRWQPSATGKDRFQFILRREGHEAPPVVNEVGLTASEIVLTDLPAGTYRWAVGRWISEYDQPMLKWDDERELVITR